MGMWLTLMVLLNVLSAVMIVVVFALVKNQGALRQDIRRVQKEWVEWRAKGAPASSSQASLVEIDTHTHETELYVSESNQINEPSIMDIALAPLAQAVRPRVGFADDWRPSSSAGGILEKAAKSLRSETVGDAPGDRFSKARELLRQGHGMKEVAVVTGLSYSELALISKTESNI